MERKESAGKSPALAFISVFLIYFGIMFTSGYLVPGSTAFYETTYYHEILPYIQSFLQVLKGEESLWYSFSVLWGSGTIGSYAAYAFSPFNLLYFAEGLFSLAFITCLICGLKLGLAAASFFICAKKISGYNDRFCLFFAVSYALSSCLLLLSTRPMWLDACYMLPLLVLLVRRLVNDRKFLGLIPAVAYTVFCCFSVAYPVLIFTFLLLLLMLFLKPGKAQTIRERAGFITSRLLLFLSAPLVTFLLGAFLLLPLFYMLRDHSLMRAAFPGSLTTIGDILSALFYHETPGFSAAVPYLYCGIPLLLLLPFYFLDQNGALREKIGVVILFSICTLAMLFDPLWHIFDLFSDGGIAYRFSFCIVFLLCMTGLKGLHSFLSSFSEKEQRYLLYIIGAVSLIFYGLMLPVRELNGIVSDNASMLSRNAFLILLWIAVIRITLRSRKLRLAAVPFVILSLELFFNGSALFQNFPSAVPLSCPLDEIDRLRETVAKDRETLYKDPSLFRVRLDGTVRINDGVAGGIASLSSSSPFDSADLRQNLHYLGIAQGSGRIYDYSSQELTDLLFGVRYHADVNTDLLEENRCHLPIAYAVSPAIADYAPTYNPFVNDALIIQKMTGRDYTFFSPVDANEIFSDSFNLEHVSDTDKSYFIAHNSAVLLSRFTFSFPRDGHQALLVDFYREDAALRTSCPLFISQELTLPFYHPRLSDSAVISGSASDSAGFFTDNDRFYITLGSEDPPLSGDYDYSYITYYDNDALPELAADLGAYGLELVSCASDSFTGTVTIPEDRTTLFISIPYDTGWEAFVDGHRTALYPLLNHCFCGLDLAPGDHQVTLQYSAKGSTAGALISMVTVFLTVSCGCIVFLRRGKKAEIKTDRNEAENA